jgi:NifU-like N terminal domain
MTATCREACCSVTPRHTVSELFERGFRRNRAAPLPIEGAQLDVADGKIAGVGFRTTSCATLIAYCEFIAESVPGFRIEIARELTAANLAEALPGVPALKRERAMLAIAAFRAALTTASSLEQPGESRNEGRLHLRHPAP